MPLVMVLLFVNQWNERFTSNFWIPAKNFQFEEDIFSTYLKHSNGSIHLEFSTIDLLLENVLLDILIPRYHTFKII
jgi:hypothetical protein